jgi:hypothetical protein
MLVSETVRFVVPQNLGKTQDITGFGSIFISDDGKVPDQLS